MKITLIQPKSNNYNTEADGHWQLTRPFSLFYLAAAIERYTKHEVNILDFENKRYGKEDITDVIRKNDSEIFAITATTYTRFRAIEVAKIVKSMFPKSLVIVGGCHFTYCAKETLEKVPEIDVVIRGEGEVILTQLCNAVYEKKSLDEIKGVTYRRNNEIFENEDQDVFQDLDDLPIYTKFSWDEYPEYIFGIKEKIRAVSIMASRGCPGTCVFCSKAGMKYRVRDYIKVVDEIEFYKNKFDVYGFNFLDLTFTANPQYARAICNEIIKRNLSIKWWCESRINIPLDLLELMKKAGCETVAIGIESGSSEILKGVSKNIDLVQVKSFVKKCSQIGMGISGYFMFSHPNEKQDDVEKTLQLINELSEYVDIDSFAFQPAIIFPGTQLEKIAREKGLIPKNFSWFDEYYNDLNLILGQLINIPLFIDELSPRLLIKYKNDFQKLREKLVINRAININIELKYRYKEYYEFMSKWFEKTNSNIDISRYLKDRMINKICIYGTGNIGINLYKVLKEIFNIECFIDKNQNKSEYDNIKVIRPEDISDYNDVECIIVTPIYDFDIIESRLKHLGFKNKIISIEDLLYS